MELSPAPKQPIPAPSVRPAPLFRRLGQRFMALDVHDLATIKVEDMALAGGYFLLFWLLDSVNLNGFGSLSLAPFESAWPAIAVLGCMGVLFRRSAPLAMAWMCGAAVVGLLLAGHGGAFILAFEFFFSLVLFGSLRASQYAAQAAWVLTVVAVIAAFAASRSGALTVAVGIVAVVSLLTPVEWAGNLRKANQLVNSEHARANAVEEAGRQRLLAERSAHDLTLDRERQHMARELHDVLSARLSAIALQSGAALHVPSPAPSARTLPVQTPAVPDADIHRAVLTQIRAESVAGLAELNAMIRLLHTGAVAETTGQLSDLAGLAVRYQGAGMALSYSNTLHDGGALLPLPLQSTVYRVAAEALVNAAKHAADAPVAMVLSHQALSQHAGAATTPEPLLVLSVSTPLPNSGTGHPAPAPIGTGTGIPSMHFRATHAGGTVTAGPVDGQWQVLLCLPLPPADPQHHETRDVQDDQDDQEPGACA